MDNSQATINKSEEISASKSKEISTSAIEETTLITTTDTMSLVGSQSILESQATNQTSTVSREMSGVEQTLLPMQIEQQATQELSERAGRIYAGMEARYSAPIEQPIPQLSPLKARRERKARIAAGKQITPIADEYTSRIADGMSSIKKTMDISTPDVDVDVYKERARTQNIDERQLRSLQRKAALNEAGEADQNELARVKQENAKFYEEYTSGDKELQKPHIDRIIDEILEFKITPNMFEPERMVRNLPEIFQIGQYLTCLSDMREQFPWYFEELPPLKKDLLDNFTEITRFFADAENCSINRHAVSLNTMNVHTTPDSMQHYEGRSAEAIANFQIAYQRFVERRSDALRSEADRLATMPISEDSTPIYVQPIGQGAYKYGMPTADQTKEILKLQARVTDEEFDKTCDGINFNALLESAENFHNQLNDITAENSNRTLFMTLLAKHQEYIEKAVSLSQTLGNSKYKRDRAVAGALGFVAMKTMSYSAVIANLEAEFKYGVSMGDVRALKTRIDDSGLGEKFEGRHMREQYKGVEADSQTEQLPVLSDRLRKLVAKEIANDKDLAAIAMTIDAYEDFLDSAQVPPCQTAEERAAYPERIKLLCDELLAFNDRVTTRALGYLQTNSRRKKKACKALEETVLERDSKENNFERVAELAYRLQHNDFSNDDFNANYTGKTVTEALRNTKIATVEIKSDDFHKAGDAASIVYISRNYVPEQAVYRRGVEYRPWKDAVNTGVDLDEAKGGISGFNTTKGRFIDARKSSRDVAVSRVDKLLGAGVIADASHVLFSVDGKEATIGTKMEKGEGKEAQRFGKRSFFGHAFGEADASVNLSASRSIINIYWLQVVDAICGSADRHRGNFFLKTNRRGEIEKITGIDNDMAFGENFLPMKNRQEQMNICSKNKNPFFLYTPVYDNAFPCIPLEIYEKVMGLTAQELAKELRGSIRDSELEVTIDRLNALKEHLSSVPQYDMNDASQAEDCLDLTSSKVDELLMSRDKISIAGNYFAFLTS